jgi:AcrR family transcriptional regulator
VTRRTQAERSEGTRAALLSAARGLFAERGYAGVSTEDIVAAAAVTRGALYHHYRDKRDLFRAVFEQLEADLAARLAVAGGDAPDAYTAIDRGVVAFLDACLEQDVARIALLDAPGVLGWQTWREIEARYGLGLVAAALTAAVEDGLVAAQPIEPLAHALFGALTEMALLIANATDQAAARRDAEIVLRGLIAGLLRPPADRGRPSPRRS